MWVRIELSFLLPNFVDVTIDNTQCVGSDTIYNDILCIDKLFCQHQYHNKPSHGHFSSLSTILTMPKYGLAIQLFLKQCPNDLGFQPNFRLWYFLSIHPSDKLSFSMFWFDRLNGRMNVWQRSGWQSEVTDCSISRPLIGQLIWILGSHWMTSKTQSASFTIKSILGMTVK